MYEPSDRHGWLCDKTTFFTYSPDIWQKKYEKEKEKNKELEEKIKKYEDLKKDNNINVIDGKICYREFQGLDIDNVDVDDDYLFSVSVSGCVVYKDVDTDKIIASRDIKSNFIHGDK